MFHLANVCYRAASTIINRQSYWLQQIAADAYGKLCALHCGAAGGHWPSVFIFPGLNEGDRLVVLDEA